MRIYLFIAAVAGGVTYLLTPLIRHIAIIAMPSTAPKHMLPQTIASSPIGPIVIAVNPP